jgi:hypothetical protein
VFGSGEPELFLEVFDNVFWAALSDLRLGELDLPEIVGGPDV